MSHDTHTHTSCAGRPCAVSAARTVTMEIRVQKLHNNPAMYFIHT